MAKAIENRLSRLEAKLLPTPPRWRRYVRVSVRFGREEEDQQFAYAAAGIQEEDGDICRLIICKHRGPPDPAFMPVVDFVQVLGPSGWQTLQGEELRKGN